MSNNSEVTKEEERTCPRCNTVNDARAENCSKCSLDFNFLDYMMDCFSGSVPEGPIPSVVLKTGEVAYFSSPVNLYAHKTEVNVHRRYIGTRVQLAGMPIYLGQSSPVKESYRVLVQLGQGDFVMTNQRIIAASGSTNISIPLNKILDFGFFGDAIQIIINEGRYSGTIYEVSAPWRLWVLLVTKLKVEPMGKLLETSNPAKISEEDRGFVLNIIKQKEQMEKSRRNWELMDTYVRSTPATVIWTIIFPPVGFYSLYKNERLGGFSKLILTFVGLYSLSRWISLLQ